MSREIRKDLESLLEFLTNYSLEDIVENNQLVDVIKPFHKAYFSYITLLFEMQNQNTLSDQVKTRLIESASDIGYTFFLLCHGCYKPANIMLRSSLENFVKALIVDKNPVLLEEKAVYKIFDEASNIEQCDFLKNNQNIDHLYGFYSNLCKYAHTSSEQEMAQLVAFNWLPNFDQISAKQLATCAKKITKQYILIILHIYRESFFCINYQHRDLILEAISSEHRKILHEGCE